MKTEYYLVVAAVTAGVYIVWSGKKAVKEAAHAVSPTNNNNVVQQGLNAATGHDGKSSTWSTGILDAIMPDYDPNAYKRLITK